MSPVARRDADLGPDWLASAMGEAAGWLFEAVWTVFDTTTLVDVTSGEYVGVYNLIFGIAVSSCRCSSACN